MHARVFVFNLAQNAEMDTHTCKSTHAQHRCYITFATSCISRVLTDLEGYNRENEMLYSLFVFLFNNSKSELVYLNPVLQNISPEFNIK